MKTLFYIPTMLLNTLQSLLPRSLFIRSYSPSNSTLREVEHNVRNVERLLAYKAKKVLGL